MGDRSAERQAMLEEIIADPRASHADRLLADERLADPEPVKSDETPGQRI
jgi:hypothetical protein